MVKVLVRVRSLAPVIICSLALSKATALAAVKPLPKVRAKSPRLKVVILKAAVVVRVELADSVTLVGAVKVVAVVVRSPFKIRVLPVKSRVPPVMVPVPFKAMLPPVLVI